MSHPYRGGVVLAEVTRSGFVEGRHYGSLVVLDSAGVLVASMGDPTGAIFPRSSNKPLQAVGMLRSGLKVPAPGDVAIVAASHSGEPFHTERIRSLLGAGGLTEAALACPPDLPLSEPAKHEVLRSGGIPASILMNCSGKHAGMLLTCVQQGWPVEGYLRPQHPVQQACRAAVEDLAGESVAAVGVDGCGAPVLAISLTGLASSFLRLVNATPGTPERLVADAMRANPELMSGTGTDDARLMRSVASLLTKGGAEGVAALALPGVGAVAMKVDDGAGRARLPVLVAALRRLGVTSAELDELAEVTTFGGGRPVGRVSATLTLP